MKYHHSKDVLLFLVVWYFSDGRHLWNLRERVNGLLANWCLGERLEGKPIWQEQAAAGSNIYPTTFLAPVRGGAKPCTIARGCLISAVAGQLCNFFLSHKSSGGWELGALRKFNQHVPMQILAPKRIIKFDQHVPNGLQSWKTTNISDLGDWVHLGN